MYSAIALQHFTPFCGLRTYKLSTRQHRNSEIITVYSSFRNPLRRNRWLAAFYGCCAMAFRRNIVVYRRMKSSAHAKVSVLFVDSHTHARTLFLIGHSRRGKKGRRPGFLCSIGSNTNNPPEKNRTLAIVYVRLYCRRNEAI